jgi:hypothetical protein
MPRKPTTPWEPSDLLESFLKATGRELTRRQLMRITSGWRDKPGFDALLVRMVVGGPGLPVFEARSDSAGRIIFKLIDRGY